MSDRTTVMYYYDGTYNGFLSCVFESFAEKETPAAILPVDEADQTCLFGAKYIETDLRRAERVRVSIPKKMGMEAQDILERAFFTCMPEKELRMLEFMRLGYKVGRGVCGRLTEPAVDKITKAVQFLEREAHLYLGFLRFAEYGDVLIAQIEPKNSVLPVIAPTEFLQAEHIELPPESPEEEKFRAMWRTFYDTVGIEGRRNDLCRRTHMPKRYWNRMTEMRDKV